MSKPAPGTEILTVADEFPPVSDAAWEVAIRGDLKGADYDKKLIWRPEDGISVRPYYRREDLTGLEAQAAPPGEFPFARGGGKPWEEAQRAEISPGAVRADLLHEAGADAVQELGYSLAEGVERLAELSERRKSVDLGAREIGFVFTVGSNFFFEIAKLRAARLLWAQAVSAFGPEKEEACLLHIHVRTSRRNKSRYDRYTNLLRATTEALSAVIGGCDRLTVEPFGFDAHLALNLQRLLREEAHVDVPADPGGGAWFLEVLTDLPARAGWKLFQQVEAAGGYRAAVAGGAIQKAIDETRAGRQKAVALRRRTLVGVNNYPDTSEKTSDVAPPGEPAPGAFPASRFAEPFERIRERTARHARATGRYPRVLLLQRGDPKMRRARANFSLNFFGCAGFDVIEAEDYTGQPADLIVLCSSDPEYLPFAREICARVQAPVIVAGYPKDALEDLKAAGVQGFIHLQSNAVETLTEWQNRLGMEK